ncbi:MAG: outer membrane beta-barrel protein [Cryomorphaceae bacterium]
MKKVFSLLALVAALTFAFNNANAQESFGNAGLEFALPLGDWAEDSYGIGIGGSGGYEFGISDNFAATANVGIIFFSVDDAVSDFIASTYMIPIQVGGRYYLDEQKSGLFLEGQVGVHMFAVSTEDIDLGPLGTVDGETTSETYLSLAPSVGYFLNESISLSLRYQLVLQGDQDSVDPVTGAETTIDGENLGYLGLRAAFHF